jgi:sugar phosphate isomerase/epimerase
MTRNEFLKTMAGATAVIASTGAAGFAAESCAPADASSKAIKGLRFGVSIYSYGGDFMSGAATVERCAADIANMGAEGIELLGEAHVKGYPNPSKEWIDNWYKLLDQYKLTPTAYEKYDIKLALELHSPTHLRSKWIDGMLELIQRTKTEHIGFCPDFSAFTWRPQKGTVERMVAQGCKKEIVEYIISAYQQDLGPDKTVEEVKKMGGNEQELAYASKAGLYHQSNNNPADIKIIAPYIYHTHAKFYNIEDDLSSDYSMKYPEILKAYVDNGVKGWLSSECEGGRSDISRQGHVRLQQAMMRRILTSL